MLKARSVINRSTLITLYYSFVYPYFIYCNHIWGTSTNKNMKRLFTLQKKAVRLICHAKFRADTDPLFKEFKFLNVWQINKFLIGQFMYKHQNLKLPALFDDNFTRFSDIHSIDTRQSPNQYQIPRVRTEYRKASICFRGPSIWNDIMKKHISPDVTLMTFKYHLKVLLLSGSI